MSSLLVKPPGAGRGSASESSRTEATSMSSLLVKPPGAGRDSASDSSRTEASLPLRSPVRQAGKRKRPVVIIARDWSNNLAVLSVGGQRVRLERMVSASFDGPDIVREMGFNKADIDALDAELTYGGRAANQGRVEGAFYIHDYIGDIDRIGVSREILALVGSLGFTFVEEEYV